VRNTSADGRSIKLEDQPGEITEWSLVYTNLADEEVTALQQFFADAEGTLNEFTFVDPTSNLLAWSDLLNNAVWQPGPLLSVQSGIADPAGGTNAWHLANSGGGPQSLLQTISAPAGYLYCFSAYVRSQGAVNVTMLLGSQRCSRAVNAGWTRIEFAAKGDPAGESIGFGLEVPAGGAVDVYGMQAEPQTTASAYKSTTKGGVYESARLRDDLLAITTIGVNCHSSTVNILHANHL
jgi:hypothetical protein